jgi:formylglycine-generating enzyme required for sulfatase activity
MGFNNRSMGDMDEWGRPKKEASIHLPTMVTIPAGSFVMGTSEEDIKRLQLKESDWAYDWSDNNLFAAEQPQHQVSVKAFEIGQYPITNQEYNDFLFDTGHRLPKHWIGFTYPDETGLHPVVGVSKLDAEAYIQWLSKRTNSSFRLPTEAEWEYGARSADGRIYPWGNTFDPWRCNTSESGKKGTTQVGSYSPGGDSPFGLADMVGNVWEWTSSCFLPYPFQLPTQAEIDCETQRYVLRGGAWYYTRKLARCAAREGNAPPYFSLSIGFRIARSK